MEASKYAHLFFLCLIFYEGHLTIHGNNYKSISFLSDYVKWRKIQYLIILDETNYSGFKTILFKEDLYALVNKNIYFTIHTSMKYSEDTIKQNKHKTAIVMYLRENVTADYILEKAFKISHLGEKAAWLIIASCNIQRILMNTLANINFGLNMDIVVAMFPYFQQKNFNYTDWRSLFNNEEAFLPFYPNLNNDIDYCSNLFNLQTNVKQEMYVLYQLFKIKQNENQSLVVHPLGLWDTVNSTKNLVAFWKCEDRRNFYQFPLVFGTVDQRFEGFIQESDIDPRYGHFPNFLSLFLNSSKIIRAYNKVGHIENGEWTDLLQGIFVEDIDLSSEGVPVYEQTYNDMSFSFNVLKNTRSIYIEQEKSQKLRNIFLMPFDNRLISCVLGTGLILSVVISINNYVDSKFCSIGLQSRKKNLVEAIVWCIGVFCNQGSIWKSKSYSQKMIVLIALMFTLIIFNAYSAFITSILSVELRNIHTVTDLLESNYKIVYVRESSDEDYLRAANNSELKQIYLRGYLENDIRNISMGLNKVIDGNYGLFASSQAARMELWNMTKCRCKFDIDEVKIHYTEEYNAIAMPKRSSYKKLINLSLIRAFESGLYKYSYALVYPNIQRCSKPKTHHSARLVDVSTAFFILGFGWTASLVIVILECLWKKRELIFNYFKKGSNAKNEMNVLRSFYVKRPYPFSRTSSIWSRANKNEVFDYTN